MQAVYFEEFDGESIVVRDVEDPREPGPGEVLVRVRAAGLNRADLMQARGSYPPPPGYLANIPGLEFAGEIVAVGEGVTDWNNGDRVMAITSGEGQAEKVVIDPRLLMRIPGELSFTEAAAIPETFITAHDAVFSQGQLSEGETLLIHAVGSGVGLSALQMAKSRGIAVVGTSRTGDKLERCREFGLDLGIETADGPVFAERIKTFDQRGVDVVLELVGGDYFAEDIAALALKGRVILVGLTAGRRSEIDLGMTLQKRAKIIGTTLRMRSTEEKAAATQAFANDFLQAIASGKITPVVDRVFPVAEAREAYAYLASNESFGKVVLEF
jgi:putative PIG3 family NAD(P)H quinone oxidoreductase